MCRGSQDRAPAWGGKGLSKINAEMREREGVSVDSGGGRGRVGVGEVMMPFIESLFLN